MLCSNNKRNEMKLATLKGFYNENITITISSLHCTIGRSRSADFIIAHVNVSRNHCEIVKEDSCWKISDYSSSGTYINDSLVGRGKSAVLNNGDVVRFGPPESKLCWSFQSFDSSSGNTTSSDSNLQQQTLEEKEIISKNKDYNSSTVSGSDLLRENEETSPVEKQECNEENKNEKVKLKKELDQVQCTLNDEEEKNCAVQKELAAGTKLGFLENLTDLMEAELQCIICSELFLQAVTLSCTHTFCKFCIDQWKKKQKTCPICRKKITNETRSLVVDNYIDKMLGNLSFELKERREAITKERNETKPPKKRSKLKNKNS